MAIFILSVSQMTVCKGLCTSSCYETIMTYTLNSAVSLNFKSGPETATAESLAADTSFAANVADSIAVGLGVDPSKVTITMIRIIKPLLRVTPSQDAKLKFDYKMVTTSFDEAEAAQATLHDPLRIISFFMRACTKALVEKEAVAGRKVELKNMEVGSVSLEAEMKAPNQATLIHV